MAIADFVGINMPYGMIQNSKKEWFVFNRAFMPLGFNNLEFQMDINDGKAFNYLPVYTRLGRLTEDYLWLLADKNVDMIRRDNKGKIVMVLFYNDTTDPKLDVNWPSYCEKLHLLSKCKRIYAHDELQL